jgi:superfamily II DNA or RNA helicase
MPRIFDNIERSLLPALREGLALSDRADFCVGYFNLRGWKSMDGLIERWQGGEGSCCRLLVGMQRLPQEELRDALSLLPRTQGVDLQTAVRLKRRLAEEFREQLTLGAPTDEDEAGLRRLAAQLRAGKLVVKLFLRHTLHAKLYLLFRSDPINPIIGFLGSSNLTFAGLAQQGELNVDVLDHDACLKLATWFEDRWKDRFCLDISNELLEAIDQSWAREELYPPYLVYLKMVYHLAREARAGLAEFRIPKDFGGKLLAFQTAAVKIAAHHLNKRGGVLLGDVVGLGKTLMATALARIFEDDHGLETLILCPRNLVRMWEDYREQYRLRARVLPITRVVQELPDLRRYRLVLIDESHNLRNREGKRYRAIREYIEENESKVILLSATPYNKTYLDLSSQLRLFVPEDARLGLRPERLLRELGEPEFIRRHQCRPDSLAAFEKSEHTDDWRELMRLFLVRRTRTFIQENYAETDEESGRRFLTFDDGTRSYFPARVPRAVRFPIAEGDPRDAYARLFSDDVVAVINSLSLPRYGLGNYVASARKEPPTAAEARILANLSRAGRRLMGFCRTNLFKRLESSGWSFLQSVERHVLRNFVFLHAIEAGLPLPIGTQDSAVLDPRFTDVDAELATQADLFEGNGNGEAAPESAAGEVGRSGLLTEDDFRRRAGEVYRQYETREKHRFKWLRSDRFIAGLAVDLLADSRRLLSVLHERGSWDPAEDRKLEALIQIVTDTHAGEKVLLFSQFADTVAYLERELRARGVGMVEAATGASPDPTLLAWRFSPESNGKRKQIAPADEIQVLLATDVLSEGQNLQDCRVVVNYDLPWAIIRLIQRVGRIDRIGQRAEKLLCYSFLPADGVERIIRLRSRVRQRLRENAEVVGTDERFFDDEEDDGLLFDLYNEKSGLLDGEGDNEVDLASYAYQLWRNATEADPSLEKKVAELPDVVYSTRSHEEAHSGPPGVLLYLRTSDDNDFLAWVDGEGNSVTQSQLTILEAARCDPGTPALVRQERHHELVRKGVELIAERKRSGAGALGRPSGARFRTYERLKQYVLSVQGSLFDFADLHRAIDEIYRFPLRSDAVDQINRQLRAGIDDPDLVRHVLALREEDQLCIVREDEPDPEPRIICSLGLRPSTSR